ncbi:sulfatase-like hydrolase/transferase [uncultured Algibacter sp.]|uniref:sulfatase-like hydrolase/transferase n=1 Tax=uncultured Algibacter sp. TaxID=298659 RepID=UPI00260A21A3|nr:sulfatase-like hydrolase/transferase [uncultured Algibacter sp.]
MLVLIVFMVFSCKRKEEKIKPNLIFVYSDQHRRMGLSYYNDARFDGTVNQGDPVKTPNLDNMAKEGVIFHNSVVVTPLCSPNRATLMTGNYPSTHQLVDNANYQKFDYDNITIAHILSKNGYETAHLGKWHIDKYNSRNWEKFTATKDSAKRGFKYWYGTPTHNHQHFDIQWNHYENEIDGLGAYAKNGKPLPNPFTPSKDYKDLELRKQESWGPNHLTRKALDYLKNSFKVRDNSKPFALYVSYNPPHTIHGPKPIDGNEASYRIAGKAKKNSYYGKGSKGSESFDYKAPLEYEIPYRTGTNYSDSVRTDLKRRPNVPNNHYSQTKCLPGYYGAINSIDDNFGKLETYLANTPDPRYPDKMLKETSIVVYTADHGEMMGSQGRMVKRIFYEESIGVPLIIRWPKHIQANTEENKVFNSVDLAPTLLGLMDLSFTNSVDGKDWSKSILSAAENKIEYAFVGYKNWRSVRTETELFTIEFDENRVVQHSEFYNLKEDPFQMNPIMNDLTIPRVQELKTVLEEHLDNTENKKIKSKK